MHLQPVFKIQREAGNRKEEIGKRKYSARVVEGGVSEDLFNRGLCLPSGTAMNEEDLDRVVNVIKSCRKEKY